MTGDPLAWLLAREGVPSAFAAARDAVDQLLRDRGLRRTGPEQTAEALLRGAHASAVLEGSASSLEDLRAAAGDEVAVAAVRLSTELLGQARVLARSPLQALARLHALAAGGSLDPDRVGRPRDVDGANHLRRVAELLTSHTTAPALLVAAVVHAEIAATAPFASHNGLVARAAERLVLVARGVDPRSVLVPEAGYLALRAAYGDRLADCRDGGAAGMVRWARYAADASLAALASSPLRG